MDIESVHEMINLGFRLGIHGHQHRTQVSPQTISIPSESTMALVSAGSLCVGSRELPPGERRQYNIIEIDDSYESARVHVRQMVSGHVFGPRYFEEFGGKTYTEVKWSPETTPAGTLIDKKAQITNTKILDAEKLLANGSVRDAIEMLKSISDLPSYGRKLLLKALEESGEWNDVVEVYDHPNSIQELVSLVSAYCELHKYDQAEDVISKYGAEVNIDEASKNEILRDIQVKRDIHS